jgi:hypothetical protein
MKLSPQLVPVIQVPAKDTNEAGRSVRVTSEAVSALAEPFLYLDEDFPAAG